MKKRVRCPKCDQYIVFDDSRYAEGEKLVFQCDNCGKQFAIRMPAAKSAGAQTASQDEPSIPDCGYLTVIENVFHYEQTIRLHMGDNRIGRYQKANPIDAPFETVDPSVDLLHCVLTVERDKKGGLRYVLRDGPSNTGTFVDNVELQPRERRIIYDGTLFTLGATSIILHAAALQKENG